MSKTFILGPVSLEVMTFGHHSFWPFWERALDPYQARLQQLEIVKLRITNAFEEPIQTDWEFLGDLSPGFFQTKLYRNPAGDILLDYVRAKKGISYLRLVMNAQFNEIRLLQDETRTGGIMAFSLLGRLIPYVMLKHNVITFHGVLLEHDGRGIILSAPSETGKTTHARLWRDYKHALIINGDKASCYLENQKWIAHGFPWCGSSGEYINRNVPVKAFVVIEQAKENRAERLYGLDAFNAVMPNLLYPFWDKELTGKALDHINDFLENIPVLRLCCRPDTESVDILDQALQEL